MDSIFVHVLCGQVTLVSLLEFPVASHTLKCIHRFHGAWDATPCRPQGRAVLPKCVLLLLFVLWCDCQYVSAECVPTDPDSHPLSHSLSLSLSLSLISSTEHLVTLQPVVIDLIDWKQRNIMIIHHLTSFAGNVQNLKSFLEFFNIVIIKFMLQFTVIMH